MKRVILVRHAKASHPPGLEDRDRPLGTRGECDAPEMGRRLARRGVQPGAIVSSPAQRALATARLIARELGYPRDEIGLDERIYEAEAGDLLEVVRGADGRIETLMLVGHNPGMTELAVVLAPDFREELPTCAVVALDLPADTWKGVRRGSGHLCFRDVPKRRG